MPNWFRKYCIKKELFQLNEDMIKNNNRSMLHATLMVCAVTYSLLICMSFFVSEYMHFRLLYVCALAYALFSLFIHQFIKNSKAIIFEVYIWFGIFFIYAFYASFISSPNYISVIALVCQITLPAIIMDYTYRVSLVVICFDIIYCIGASYYKSADLVVDEIINITAFTIVGIFIGYYMQKSKMENFEHRRLSLQREHIDFLTGLYNRKKLFTDMQDESDNNHITAFFMLDVDHFKAYNDNYGHPEGDACLRKLGACMLDYARTQKMRIYRFGGEEFACLIYNDNIHSNEQIANDLKQAVFDLHIPHVIEENLYVSISIGVCKIDKDKQFDKAIKSADDALYEAKRRGRNQVVLCPFVKTEDSNR